MNIPQVTPMEAKRLLESPSDVVYLDVRSAPEFNTGHPPGAINIPIAELNPAAGRMEMNRDFLSLVKQVIPVERRVIVGCQSGGRSQAAAEMMVDAGYRDVCNLAGGFGGVVTPSGEVIEDGWSTSGYAVERGDGGENSYAALRSRLHGTG
jgi:rhodanese-related sulfurtransferase